MKSSIDGESMEGESLGRIVPAQHGKGCLKSVSYTHLSHVGEVAEAVGYSSSYLSHLFKEKTGMTLQSYLARKKIERGVELMKSGCYSWTQIALELHYETPQAFSKAFRRVMQKSPSEFITNTHKKRSESNE